jgi:hypothetical protein
MEARSARFAVVAREFSVPIDRWISAMRAIFAHDSRIDAHHFCAEPFLILCGARMSEDFARIIMSEKTYRRVLDAELEAIEYSLR